MHMLEMATAGDSPDEATELEEHEAQANLNENVEEVNAEAALPPRPLIQHITDAISPSPTSPNASLGETLAVTQEQLSQGLQAISEATISLVIPRRGPGGHWSDSGDPQRDDHNGIRQALISEIIEAKANVNFQIMTMGVVPDLRSKVMQMQGFGRRLKNLRDDLSHFTPGPVEEADEQGESLGGALPPPAEGPPPMRPPQRFPPGRMPTQFEDRSWLQAKALQEQAIASQNYRQQEEISALRQSLVYNERSSGNADDQTTRLRGELAALTDSLHAEQTEFALGNRGPNSSEQFEALRKRIEEQEQLTKDSDLKRAKLDEQIALQQSELMRKEQEIENMQNMMSALPGNASSAVAGNSLVPPVDIQGLTGRQTEQFDIGSQVDKGEFQQFLRNVIIEAFKREADKIHLDPIHSVTQIKEWRKKARKNVAAASGDPHKVFK